MEYVRGENLEENDKNNVSTLKVFPNKNILSADIQESWKELIFDNNSTGFCGKSNKKYKLSNN